MLNALSPRSRLTPLATEKQLINARAD
jgi:hypothetical protein